MRGRVVRERWEELTGADSEEYPTQRTKKSNLTELSRNFASKEKRESGRLIPSHARSNKAAGGIPGCLAAWLPG